MRFKPKYLFFLQLFTHQILLAQLPYTQKLYPVAVQTDIPFGTATNFAGGTDSLVLDLYKPIGDANCHRPLLVMAHGGGFIAGTKADADVVQLCQEMAARGYVTASVKYRLGVHMLDYYEPYAFCNDGINPFGMDKCIYMADTLEIIRAMYRAQQDVKGAIRFLKGRHDLDSTDMDNVFVGGSSAGAIAALNVALMDAASDKPTEASAQTDAPVPDPDLASCVPAPANRSRPDLGPVEGTLNLNGHDASVQGVADFMGGIFDISLLNGGEFPAFYLYHRTDDLVVPSNTAPLFPLYPYCINPVNLCQPLYTRPVIHGSETIRNLLNGMGTTAPPFFSVILDSYGPAGSDDCFDNPSGHSIEDIPLRCESLGNFFAPIIAENGNTPSGNCASGTHHILYDKALSVYPNPVKDGGLNITCTDCPASTAQFRLMDVTGRTVAATHGNPQALHWKLPDVQPGLYFLLMVSPDGNGVVRVCF